MNAVVKGDNCVLQFSPHNYVPKVEEIIDRMILHDPRKGCRHVEIMPGKAGE